MATNVKQVASGIIDSLQINSGEEEAGDRWARG
jgi:hypothetical protein